MDDEEATDGTVTAEGTAADEEAGPRGRSSRRMLKVGGMGPRPGGGARPSGSEGRAGGGPICTARDREGNSSGLGGLALPRMPP